MKRSLRLLPALALLLPITGCDNSGGPTVESKSGTAGAPAGAGDSKTATKSGKTGTEAKPTAPN